jgi:serine protease inhibitor
MKRFVLPILLAAALPAADSRIMPAMNAFTIDSYKQLMRGDANLILSPFNIATPLSMALAGTRGQRSQINRWTEEHTKEKIKDLFPAGSLDAQTRLVLTSAIYFYCKWQDPFVTSRTQPAPFTLPTGLTS